MKTKTLVILLVLLCAGFISNAQSTNPPPSMEDLIAATKTALGVALAAGKSEDVKNYASALAALTSVQYIAPMGELQAGISKIAKDQFAPQIQSLPTLIRSGVELMAVTATTPEDKAIFGWLAAKDPVSADAAASKLPRQLYECQAEQDKKYKAQLEKIGK